MNSEAAQTSLPILGQEPSSRRGFLKACGATLGLVAWATALKPLTEWAQDISVDEFLQKHYRELNPTEKQAIFARLEEDCRQEHGVDVTISDPQPIPGVQFAYALNLSICIGCRKCAEACHIENNHDRLDLPHRLDRLFDVAQEPASVVSRATD